MMHVSFYSNAAIENYFQKITHNTLTTVEKNHGRIETRKYWVTDNISWLNNKEKWKGLQSIGVAEATREIGDKIPVEKRVYITSKEANAKSFAEAVRNHWQVENNLHWSLDVSFDKDQCRVRKGHGAENFAVLRHLALNLLKRENSVKFGIANKRLRAGWDKDYLAKVLERAQN